MFQGSFALQHWLWIVVFGHIMLRNRHGPSCDGVGGPPPSHSIHDHEEHSVQTPETPLRQVLSRNTTVGRCIRERFPMVCSVHRAGSILPNPLLARWHLLTGPPVTVSTDHRSQAYVPRSPCLIWLSVVLILIFTWRLLGITATGIGPHQLPCTKKKKLNDQQCLG